MATFRMPGGGLGCGPDTGVERVTVAGKPVYFTFDRRFGPLLTDKDGEPLRAQPTSGGHPFWAPFRVWLDAWLRANPEPPRPAPLGDKWDRRA